MTSATGSHGSRVRITVTPFRLLAVSVLVAGWLVGGITHARWMIATGWGDIVPPLVYLALALVLWAGVTAWAVLPRHGRMRAGAYAGMLTFVVTVVAQVGLIVSFLSGDRLTGGDETWFSFLLESWFWIGLPLLVSATLGAFGWWATDVLYRYTHPHERVRRRRR